MTFKCFCYENLQDYFDFWPFRLDPNCFFIFILTYLNIPYVRMFPYYWLWTVLSYFSKSLPNGVHYRARHPHPPHARVVGAERSITVTHSETPSCAWRCGLVQTTVSSLQARFQTCHLCFPWHRASVVVLVSLCVLTTTATLLHSAPMLILFSLNKSRPQAVKDCNASYGWELKCACMRGMWESVVCG